MTFLYSKIVRKVIINLILIWSVFSFWLLSQTSFVSVAITVLAFFCILFIWFEVYPIVLLIFLSFIASYAFYGFLFQFNLPTYVIMVAILLVFGYLFLYTEQKIGILGNKRMIYLALFSLIILEIFLVLSFFLINPLSKSLIIATVCYLFVGFCYTILAKHTDNKFTSYLFMTLIAIILIFATSSWGGSI